MSRPTVTGPGWPLPSTKPSTETIGELSAALPPVVRDCVARNRIFGGAAGYMRPKKAAAASAAANGANSAKAK